MHTHMHYGWRMSCVWHTRLVVRIIICSLDLRLIRYPLLRMSRVEDHGKTSCICILCMNNSSHTFFLVTKVYVYLRLKWVKKSVMEVSSKSLRLASYHKNTAKGGVSSDALLFNWLQFIVNCKKKVNRWYKISAKCIYVAQETRKYKLNWLNFGKNNEKQKRDFCGKHDSQSLWKSNSERNGDTARKASTLTANDT